MTPLEKLIAVFNRYRASKDEPSIIIDDYVISDPIPYKGPVSERNTKITLKSKRPTNGKYRIYYLYYDRIDLYSVLDDLYVARDGAESLAEILVRSLNDEMKVDFAVDDFDRVSFNDSTRSFILKATSKNIIFTGSKQIIFEEFKDVVTTMYLASTEANIRPTITRISKDVNLMSTIRLTEADAYLT